MPVALSVFDFGLVSSGSTAAVALRDMVDLAAHVERWGYHRFWMSEHHNMPAVSTSSPAILVARVAAATSTMRVGSGGVILPNHAPLVVAEQFGTLEALFPGRIDLGLGRAPDMDPLTSAALRRVDGYFVEQLAELRGYFSPGDPAPAVVAVPAPGNRPPLWLLGTGIQSSELAGALGLPFAFAHHLNPGGTLRALASYREHFRPSGQLDRPYAMVAVSVLVADTDDEARRLSAPSTVNFLSARRGQLMTSLPSNAEAAEFDYTDDERAFARGVLVDQAIGAPDTVRDRLAELVADTGADELMAVTVTHDHADRLRSYELLAAI